MVASVGDSARQWRTWSRRRLRLPERRHPGSDDSSVYTPVPHDGGEGDHGFENGDLENHTRDAESPDYSVHHSIKEKPITGMPMQ